jgi:hypothetical protein
VGQIQSGKFSPQLRAFLNSLSLRTPNQGECEKCGGVLVNIDAQFWLYEDGQHWTLKLPLCATCDSETLNAIPRTFAA